MTILRNGNFPHIRLLAVITLALTAQWISSCSTASSRQPIPEDKISTLDGRDAYLKAHLRNGDMFHFSQWSVNEPARQIRGRGSLFDFNRHPVYSGDTTLSLDSVAVFETNSKYMPPSIALTSLVTGASLGMTGYCMANPKACFGSCPTFYLRKGNEDKLVAEGFSGSIAPSLEATDWDPVATVPPEGGPGDFVLQVRNEALETHVIRGLSILAFPHKEEQTVLADASGGFYEASWTRPVDRCTGSEGNCLEPLKAEDGNERTSLADEHDLAARETLEVVVEHWPGGDAGVVISARQSLLPTFLFYQMLSYMGRDAGTWFSRLETNGSAILGHTVADKMGGIEVWIPDKSGVLTNMGEMRENGPLAVDRQVVPLGHLDSGSIRIQIRMAKGYWRLDQMSLVRLEHAVYPVKLVPVQIQRNGKADAAALLEIQGGKGLLQMPGDAREIHFRLPESSLGWVLFLESRGYYWEWMRQEWLKEENPMKAVQMVFEPEKSLRELAPEFKKVERGMETIFWKSRYGRF